MRTVPITRTTGTRAMWLAVGGLALTAPLHVLALLGIEYDRVALGLAGGGVFLAIIPTLAVALKSDGQHVVIDLDETLSGVPRWMAAPLCGSPSGRRPGRLRATRRITTTTPSVAARSDA